MTFETERNLGLSILRATEAAALSASRWVGRGITDVADTEAATVMHRILSKVDIDGVIVFGEEHRYADPSILALGTQIGTGEGPAMDVIVDAIEGVRLMAEGLPDAVSVAALTARGALRQLGPSVYMDKLVINSEAADKVGLEALDAPPGWTLGIVARALGRSVQDLTVFVLNRPRHQHLIEEIRSAGARVLLRQEGDVVGAVLAALPGSGVDVLMGIGRSPEGLVAACAVKAIGATMFTRLAPQSAEEHQALLDSGFNLNQTFSADDLVSSNDIFFAATGITDGLLLRGVRYQRKSASTNSLLLRGESGVRRQIYTDHPANRSAPVNKR